MAVHSWLAAGYFNLVNATFFTDLLNRLMTNKRLAGAFLGGVHTALDITQVLAVRFRTLDWNKLPAGFVGLEISLGTSCGQCVATHANYTKLNTALQRAPRYSRWKLDFE